MGLWQRFKDGTLGAPQEQERSAIPDGLFPALEALGGGIEGSYIDAVLAGLTGDYLGLQAIPAVNRAVTFIRSACASMPPVAYRDGYPMSEQPKLLKEPSSFSTRYDFIGDTVSSMVEAGEAFWWVPETTRDYDGYPTELMVVPANEVQIEWDENRLVRQYTWRGRRMKAHAGRATDFIHIPLNRRSTELHGRTWLKDCAASFATMLTAERYAADFYVSAAIPSGVIKVPITISDGDAKKLKQQFMEGQRTRTPAVLSGGIDYAATQTNPYEAQLIDTRRFGVTEVARASGIPASILLVEMQGAFDVYTNLEAVYEEACRSTLFPSYLNPIEAALSRLLPRSQTVRFSARELLRLSEKARWDVYKVGIETGVILPEEARLSEALPPNLTATGKPELPPEFAPTPSTPNPPVLEAPNA
jgi:HK97 family phage portal protein